MTAADWIVTVVLSLAPVAELRGGLPYAIARGAPPVAAFAIAVAANLLVAPLLMVILGRIDPWLARRSWTRRGSAWILERTRSRSRVVQRFGAVGLVLFVAIPLPGTGAWTGCLAAFLLGIPARKAVPLISIGVLIAGVLVLLGSVGVLRLFAGA